MDTVITQEAPAARPQRDLTDAEVQAASELLVQLDADARSLGKTAAAAQVYCAMGRVYAEQLGDAKSAAVCHQNAFLLDPGYKPNLESARRLFAGAGEHDKALALHRCEAALRADPAARAESLRAQAAVLESLGRAAEARQAIEEALVLAPDHLRLLNDAALAAQRQGDPATAARLFMRAAGAAADPVFQGRLLRSAVLVAEQASAGSAASELGGLHEEALRGLRQADAADPVGFHAMLESARAGND